MVTLRTQKEIEVITMYEIGRLCIKIAGRDARKKAIIVDILDGFFVLIDGQVRRRKCNIKHLEPLDKVLKIKKNASHSEVVDILKKEGIEVVDTKPKEKKEKTKAVKEAVKTEEKTEKKPAQKKETKTTTEKKKTTKTKK